MRSKVRFIRSSLPILACIAFALTGCGGGGRGNSSPTSTLANGLIHEWKFNGNANDSVGGQNGTVVGAVTYSQGVSGQAITLDGSTMGVTLPPVADLQFQASFSISSWANLAAYPSADKVWTSLAFDGDDRGGLDAWYLMVDPNGKMQFQICGAAGSTSVSISAPMPLTQWVLVTATYDQTSGTMNLYENGQLISQNLANTTLTPVVPFVQDGKPGTGIGTNNSFPTSAFNYGWDGAIEDFRVYDRALSAKEVLDLYNLKTGL